MKELGYSGRQFEGLYSRGVSLKISRPLLYRLDRLDRKANPNEKTFEYGFYTAGHNQKFITFALKDRANDKKYGIEVLFPPGYFCHEPENSIFKWRLRINLFTITKKISPSPYELKALQNMAICEFMELKDKLETNGKLVYIQLCMECGGGKTFTSRCIVEKLRLKTLVLVKCKYIGNQWFDEFNGSGLTVVNSTEGSKKLLEKFANSSDIDVLICPDRHLDNPDFVQYIQNNFSMLIIDESHEYILMSRNTLSKFLINHPPPYCISLSATPSKANSIYLGPRIEKYGSVPMRKQLHVIYALNKRLCSGKEVRDKISSSKKGIQVWKGQVTDPKIISNFYGIWADCDPHLDFLVLSTIKKVYVPKRDSKTILLVDHREMMIRLFSLLENAGIENCVIANAENKNTDEVIASCRNKEKFLLITTSKLGGSAMNISKANSLHLVSLCNKPSRIKQMTGRIERENESFTRNIYIYNESFLPEPFFAISNFRKRKVQKLKEILISDGWEQKVESVSMNYF